MKKKKIFNLIKDSASPAVAVRVLDESTGTTTIDTSSSRPDLVSLTRATNNLIYTDLVAIQETNLPVATLYGVRYKNQNNVTTFTTAATYSGRITSRTGIDDADLSASLVKGTLIKSSDTDVVYEAIDDIQLSDYGTDIEEALVSAIVNSKIRMVSEAAEPSHYETSDDIAWTTFTMDRWNIPVRTRKFKTELTVELIQDLESNQFDSEAVIDDVLGTVASEEINKDIIQSLITVSKRYKVDGFTDGTIDFTDAYVDSPEAGRKLYHLACEMGQEINRTTSFEGTYVLCSTRIASLLSSSGWVHESDDDHPLASGILRNGYLMYTDTTTPFDYMIVGCKYDLGDMDHVGSLFYTPYTESDSAGSIKISVAPESLQPKIAIMMRYGLSVNPYTTVNETDPERVVSGDDWSGMAGKSRLSQFVAIKMPKILS